MTTVQMLAKTRMMLDEATESFWTDDQIYAELALGQIEIVKMACDRLWQTMEVPFVLSSQIKYKDVSGQTTEYYTPQADELYTFAIDYDYNNGGTKYPCRLISVNRNVDFYEQNTYSAGTATDPIAEYKTDGTNQGWYFVPTYSVSYNATSHYIKEPSDIALGVDPELPSVSHASMVQFGFASLLSKDEDTATKARSTEELSKFYKMVETLLGESRNVSKPEFKLTII